MGAEFPVFIKSENWYNHTDNLDYQRLLMYLSKCNDEQITAILAIVEAYLRTYKIPTDHDKQDP